MRNLTFDDGYVEDSEGERDMMVEGPAIRNVVGGLPPPPQLPYPVRAMDTTVSTIQTPNFTSLPPALNRPLETPINVHNMTASTIQSANFTGDRLAVFDISSFSPIGAANSSIQTAQAVGTSSGSSISTSTSAPAPAAPRGKPRPRPVFKKKDPTAAALAADASISSGSPSSIATSSANVSFPSFYAMLPPLPPMEVSSTPSHTATTVLTTQRLSDSGVEIFDVEMMDIAERAKLRSRARSQAKGKQPITYDDVIELTSSDDELSLPKSKPKPKPKPKAKKPTASKEAIADKVKSKGKSRDPSKPSPSKRAKTTHVPDGVESDVDTIPVATSDFPIPVQQPPLPPLPPHMRHLSSQLPPSDPPPPPSTSGSSAPRTSQDAQLNANADRFRDESPLSSPPPPMPRKRKRLPPPAAVPGLDEDDSYMGTDEDSVLPGPAPGGLVPVVEITKVPKKSRSKGSDPPPPQPSSGVVPETQPFDPPAKEKEKSVPQKKKRKSTADDGEEWDLGLDEELLAQAAKSKSKKRSRVDEEDEEEYGASSSKGKGKAKKDKEKGAKKTAAKGKEKAPPKEKAAKGKGGAKGKTPSSATKDVVQGSDGEGELGISIGGDKDWDAMPPPPIPEHTSKHKEKDLPSSSSKGASEDPEAPVEVSAPKRGKGKQRALILSDDEDDGAHAADLSTNAVNASLDIDSPPPAPSKKGGRKSTGGEQGSKENEAPPPSASPPTSNSSPHAASVSTPVRSVAVTPQSARTSIAQSNRAYTISSKKNKSTPMSELIRRVSSLPGSPFPATSRPTYSPLAKGSKSALRRIAPLHPNRRTPPPPLPRPPPPKKSKKMLELEEKWEMELEDSIEGWYAMPEEERAALRRAKRNHELGFED